VMDYDDTVKSELLNKRRAKGATAQLTYK